MRLKELSREQLENLAKNLMWLLVGVGVVIIILALGIAYFLARGQP